MTKLILLKVDEGFFYKMKLDKQIREKRVNHIIKWEDYIKLLFGLSR